MKRKLTLLLAVVFCATTFFSISGLAWTQNVDNPGVPSGECPPSDLGCEEPPPPEPPPPEPPDDGGDKDKKDKKDKKNGKKGGKHHKKDKKGGTHAKVGGVKAGKGHAKVGGIGLR